MRQAPGEWHLVGECTGREEVPPPEEQERIFEEVVGEPLASVIERLARRAAAGPQRAGANAGR